MGLDAFNFSSCVPAGSSIVIALSSPFYFGFDFTKCDQKARFENQAAVEFLEHR